ncbi:helix-turn-helix transcriptional regulator [Celeribacter sp. HF31]|uniref:ArsR/SmtB family transcription factor n=1 Tax=Celeribacter sp. HF31 TaxID=2721558 RepID=UPI0014316E78|nr:helix-turn-helix domain-containing protein [Celeribacter sp. HF31]NIY79812.1 helix-turn-helix transcriptional regulator [Celeribacter sp. HF31]
MSAPRPHAQFDDLSLAEAASLFSALGSEQRLLVLRTLLRAGPKGLSIGELGNRTGITGATLTHHMKTLAAVGVVKQEKQGRSVICIAADYDQLQSQLTGLLGECCADCTDDTCTPESHCHGEQHD